MATNASVMPIVSKIYCSSSQVVLVVRRRPRVVHGGGFVVTNCSQGVVFRVDGCGILGKKGEMMLRDADGYPLLLLQRKEGKFEALNMSKKWKGYAFDWEGSSRKLIFSLKEPNSCPVTLKSSPIRISIDQPRGCWATGWDFEIRGSFQDKSCFVVNSLGNTIAQIGVKKEVEELITGDRDLYHIVVEAGMDQAFLVGVVAVLDHIYDGSTRC
ncbi:hypothetical protein NMG60_11005617 [Bertholletia excelsa]